MSNKIPCGDRRKEEPTEEFLDTIQSSLESRIPKGDHLAIYQEWIPALSKGFIRQDLTEEWRQATGNNRYRGLAAALQELYWFRDERKKNKEKIES